MGWIHRCRCIKTYVFGKGVEMDSEFRLEYYTLNERNGKIVPYNIFNNVLVYEETIKLLKKYKRTSTMTFDDFKERLRKIIMWQEWSRCEYEIIVTGFPPKADGSDEEKIDCYYQSNMNLDCLATWVLVSNNTRVRKEKNKN